MYYRSWRWASAIIRCCLIIISLYVCLALKSLHLLSSLLNLCKIDRFIGSFRPICSICIPWWTITTCIKGSLHWLLPLYSWKLFFDHLYLSLILAHHGSRFAWNWANLKMVERLILVILFLFLYFQIAMSFFYHLLSHRFVHNFGCTFVCITNEIAKHILKRTFTNW